MPYNPQYQPKAAQIMADAGQDISNAFWTAYSAASKVKREEDMLGGYVARAVKTGAMEPGVLEEFASGNRSAKMKLGTEAQLTLEDKQRQDQLNLQRRGLDLRREELDDMSDYRSKELNLHRQDFEMRKSERNWTPSENDIKSASDAQVGYVRTPKGVEVTKLPRPRLTLTPEELDAYKQAGAVPLRESDSAFVPMHTKQSTVLPRLEDLPRGIVNGQEVILLPKDLRLSSPHATGTTGKPLSMAEAATKASLETQAEKLDQEIAEHAQQIASGDERHGFMNLYSRRNTMNELEQKKRGIETQLSALQRGPAVQASAPVMRGATGSTPPAGAGTMARPSGAQQASSATAAVRKLSSANAAAIGEPPLPVSDPLQPGADDGSLLPPVPANAAAAKAPVPVKNRAEAEKLPPGTRFETPDGRILIR
jgi:hypothetical protein